MHGIYNLNANDFKLADPQIFDGYISFYLERYFDSLEYFGVTDDNIENIICFVNYNYKADTLDCWLQINNTGFDNWEISEEEQYVLLEKLEEYAKLHNFKSIDQFCDFYEKYPEQLEDL